MLHYFALAVPLCLKSFKGTRIRLNNCLAGFAIHTNRTAVVIRLQRFSQTADSGDAHGTGQDSSMAVTGATLRDDAQDFILV